MSILRSLAAAMISAMLFSSVAASAPSFPSKPIRVIDGFPPGGGTDHLARVLALKLTERFGQPVIVDNRPGAASNLAAEIVARAIPTVTRGSWRSLRFWRQA